MNGNLVLIYDKRLEISNKYKKILNNNHSAQVILVSNYDDFFMELKNNEPDLILISETVSENLSILCKEIRAIEFLFRPIIILLSKSSFLEDKTNALNAGADDFLSEPMESEEFLARINAHLRRTIEEHSSQITKFPQSSYTKKVLKRTIKNENNWAMLLIEIDNFLPYREIYGEIPALKMFEAFSAIINATLEYDDFCGHITPENFLIITSSFKAEKLADYLNYAFSSVSDKFYSQEDIERGFILLNGENKAGCKIPFVSTSIGLINSELINYQDEVEAINSLNKVQKLAKTLAGPSKVIDRPLISTDEILKLIDKKNIVVIEKDKDLAYLLETTLKIQGFNPILYKDYSIDINEMIKHSPALIILDDDNNEDKNGIELCKKIKEKTMQNIKIIFTDTAHAKEEILKAGADLYLPKPYDLMELFQWIYKILS